MEVSHCILCGSKLEEETQICPKCVPDAAIRKKMALPKLPKDWKPLEIKAYKPGFPWWRLYSILSLMGFWALVLYQISPEFQAWCNYTFRYWSRYATYSGEYMAWVMRRAWRNIPDGRS